MPPFTRFNLFNLLCKRLFNDGRGCNCVCRYVHDKGCVATTGDITVSVSTSFLPELSSVHPPHFFFTYRIRYGRALKITLTSFLFRGRKWGAVIHLYQRDSSCVFRIEMSSGASPEAACQLDSRYWKITTSDGNVEEVQGPGVVGTLLASHNMITWTDPLRSADTTCSICVCVCVCLCVCVCAGEFPVMTPGKVHEYASCTTFSTPSEYMEGHYTFHRLGEQLRWCFMLFVPPCSALWRLVFVSLVANKEEVFHVAIPRFHMVCPPFREPVVRTVKTPLLFCSIRSLTSTSPLNSFSK